MRAKLLPILLVLLGLVLAGCGGGPDADAVFEGLANRYVCLLYTSPSPRDPE